MKIQLESGSPSSATHRLTQPSTTLNRRYVSRPSNLAIEEAARSIDTDHSSRTARPSRLVNLRVHDTDLEALRAAETEQTAAQSALSAQGQSYDTPTQYDQSNQYAQYSAAPQILETYSPTEVPQFYQEPPTQTEYQNPAPQENYYNDYSAQAYPTTEAYQSPDAYHPPEPQPSSEPVYTPIALEASNPGSTLLPTQPLSATIANAADVDTRALAMSIAADYTAANLSAAMSSVPSVETTDSLTAAINEQHATKSIDEIAHIASEAISSIQSATDPAEIARQIESLQSFAAEIKSNSNPEIVELGSTIEKFIAIASKSTGIKAETAKKSTLSPKATRAATKVTKSTTKMMSTSAAKTVKPKPAARPQPLSRTAAKSPAIKRPASRPVKRTARTVKPQLPDDKDAALRKALRSVASMEEETETAARRARTHKKGGAKRFFLAFGCAAACVAAIIYFVGTNIPDISVRVAAMQTGIEASYPSYIPRGFSLDGINSEDGKITLTFTNSENGSFTITEEKSSWDSTALLRNYVEPTWQQNYTTTHEQGLTIYIYSSSAAWVNGGVLYKIDANENVLTKKQLRNIVTSIQ